MKKNHLFLYIIIFILTPYFTLSQTTVTENFEDASADGTVYNLTSESTPTGFWNGSDDDTNYRGWQIHNGQTSSGSTGPNSANGGTYYAYCETTYSGGTGTYILESDVFSSTSTTMSFYYHMYGSTIGTLTVEESSNSGTSWSTLLTLGSSGQIQTDETDAWIQATSGSGSFSAISANTNKLRIKYVGNGEYRGDAAIDDVVVTYATPPSISVGSALSSLDYSLISSAGPSSSQQTTVSGSSLDGDITVTAPTNFEISTDNSSFSSSLTLSESSGSVSSTNIYARLKDGLPVDSYSGNITCTSTNATNATIALSGDVTNATNTEISTCDGEASCVDGVWDTSGFADATGGCSGRALRDNVYGSGSSASVELWNASAITGHGGNPITVSFKAKLTTWSGGTNVTSSEWGDLKLYYKSSLPSVASPGTLFATINSASSCGTESHQFTPGSTISNLYIALVYTTESSGDDNYIWFDDLKVTENTPGRNTWDGSTDTDWSTSANWSKNSVPSSGDSPIIPDVTNQPVISDDDGSSGAVSLTALTILDGAELTINKEASLALSGNYINSGGTVTLNSDANEFATIKVGGSATGNITYNRWVNAIGTNEWDLIGSPVDGLSISSFASTNSSPLATGGGGSGNQYAIGYYDNSADDWTNYTTATIGGAGNFDIGKGYQMGTDSGATLAFTGTIATTDQTQAVQDYSGASGRIWNLVANPYPIYLNANTNADGSNNFLTVNGTTTMHDTYVAIYGYDADGSGYSIYNNTTAATYIAPGQAFMVAADNASSGTSVSMTEAMQTTTGGDDFISGDNMENTEVVVKLFNGDNELDSTKLFFDEGLTLGLDPGYDAGHFDDNAPIMTRLVEDDAGYGMAINAMGLDAMENAVIPLVINQSAGQEFRINLFTATIPDPNVYLEDVEDGTFTNLYEGDFVYTPTSDIEGVGRFFIHMTADTMSNEEVSTSMLNAYKEIDASYITIEGLATQTNETNVSLYNILGRKVLSTTLNNNMNTQTISTVGLSAGIYVIELESGTDRLTKKLIIK